MGDTDGTKPQNWDNDGGLVNQIPDDANDNVIFNNTANIACNFGPAQNALGTISVTAAYTDTITLGANTAFQACSILGACTIDLNGNLCNFGNFGLNPGVIVDLANNRRVTINGGILEVGNNEKLDLSNVALGSTVNVNANGKLYFEYITYGNDDVHRFRVNGGTVETKSPNAIFISNSDQGVYYQPIEVVEGNLNFFASTTVVSYIESSGTVLVQGTQGNPNVTLTITGTSGVEIPAALRVFESGVLLAAGSTISGTVVVYGGMNLFGAPPGSTATTCTIAQGDFKLLGGESDPADLNLNNYTLNVSGGNVVFSRAAVTTNVDYNNPNGVRMGNITVSGSVNLQNTNSLTQGHTGTPKAFNLPLLTCTNLVGDFTMYVLEIPVTTENVGNTIKLKRV